MTVIKELLIIPLLITVIASEDADNSWIFFKFSQVIVLIFKVPPEIEIIVNIVP